MNQDELKVILANHVFWLKGEGGERANLEGADLGGANLWSANLRRADLGGADLRCANLSRANLENANLENANLENANLWSAYLSRAYLGGANLEGANLEDANLWSANLRRADLGAANLSRAYLENAYLENANLLCVGNMREIRTMQIDTWEIGYTADTLQIGCQRHSIGEWRKWGTPAGRKWIKNMDDKALSWADRNLALVLALIDANPATPTGHEEKTND